MKERFARIIYVMYYICMAWLFETDLNRHNRQNCQYEFNVGKERSVYSFWYQLCDYY